MMAPRHTDAQHDTRERHLLIAAVLIGAFMVAEVIGGLISGSLALLADAGHSFSDFGALLLAWLALRFSRWPADPERSFGFGRLQILVAFGSGLALFAIAGLIVVEAIRRLGAPVEVLGGTMLAVASVGVVINVSVFLILRRAGRDNLNVRAAAVHVLGDLLGSLGTIAAAGIILTTGWMVADPLISIAVAGLIVRSAWGVVRDSGHILLEGAPRELTPSEIEADLEANVVEVEDVHHLHAWSITQERPIITLHARLRAGANADAAVRAIKQRLVERFGVGHVTVEIEREECADDVSLMRARS
jgi:cobalt-zinc-cadmium efflux system protein